MIVRQAIVLQSILGAVSFTSYHLERSDAFAVRFIPNVSYIRCSSAFILFLDMAVCLGKVVFIIFTILYSSPTDRFLTNSLLILLTWYLSACTRLTPSFS